MFSASHFNTLPHHQYLSSNLVTATRGLSCDSPRQLLVMKQLTQFLQPHRKGTTKLTLMSQKETDRQTERQTDYSCTFPLTTNCESSTCYSDCFSCLRISAEEILTVVILLISLYRYNKLITAKCSVVKCTGICVTSYQLLYRL